MPLADFKHSSGHSEEAVAEVEEVAKEATEVEGVVHKAHIEEAIKIRIEITSIREALKYNNNQTCLASWLICKLKTQQTKCQPQS